MVKEVYVIPKGGEIGGTSSSKGELDCGGGGGVLFVPEKLYSGLCKVRFVVVDRNNVDILEGFHRELVNNGGI